MLLKQASVVLMSVVAVAAASAISRMSEMEQEEESRFRMSEVEQEALSRSRRSAQPSNAQYRWLCPSSRCQDLPANCSSSEYIVIQYEVVINDHVVRVSCQTCEYCIDVPYYLESRNRRSLHNVIENGPTERCGRLTCPLVDESCHDERLTEVFVLGAFCKRCPACFDNTIVARRHRHHGNH